MIQRETLTNEERQLKDVKSLKKEYEEKKEILKKHWNQLEDKNEKYMNHLKGDCLCNICNCGKCRCNMLRIKIDSKVTQETNYMNSYLPPARNYNAGNSEIRNFIDQTKSVLQINKTCFQQPNSSRSLDSRSNKQKNDDEVSSTTSFASREMVNYSPRHLKYGFDKPFLLKTKPKGFKEFTDDQIHEMCQKTNFHRNVEEMVKKSEQLNKDPDAWKVPNLRVCISPTCGDSTYRKNFIDKQTEKDQPIIQLQELPPNVRSVPYHINSTSRLSTDQMLNQLTQLKLKLITNNQIGSEKELQNCSSESQSATSKSQSASQRHRSSSPSSKRISEKDNQSSSNSHKTTKEEIMKTFQRKNDITQHDFINYAQKYEKVQKTVFSCANKILNKCSEYKKELCNPNFQKYVIKVSDNMKLNYNQVDHLINQNVQKINKVGVFQQNPSYEGQFVSSNQAQFPPEQRQQVQCPSKIGQSSLSPSGHRQNCRENEQDLLPRKYYNHRYNRVIRNHNKQPKDDIVEESYSAPKSSQKEEIPAFINYLKSQQLQDKLKFK